MVFAERPPFFPGGWRSRPTLRSARDDAVTVDVPDTLRPPKSWKFWFFPSGSMSRRTAVPLRADNLALSACLLCRVTCEKRRLLERAGAGITTLRAWRGFGRSSFSLPHALDVHGFGHSSLRVIFLFSFRYLEASKYRVACSGHVVYPSFV